MTTPRGYRDRADDSFLSLVGDLPELVRNLVIAEVDAAKAWVRKSAKDGGYGAAFFVAALFFLFWSIPVFGTFLVWGISDWAGWPIWASALLIFGVLVVITAVFVLLGIARFKKLTARENPAQAIATDVNIVKEAGDE